MKQEQLVNDISEDLKTIAFWEDESLYHFQSALAIEHFDEDENSQGHTYADVVKEYDLSDQAEANRADAFQRMAERMQNAKGKYRFKLETGLAGEIKSVTIMNIKTHEVWDVTQENVECIVEREFALDIEKKEAAYKLGVAGEEFNNVSDASYFSWDDRKAKLCDLYGTINKATGALGSPFNIQYDARKIKKIQTGGGTIIEWHEDGFTVKNKSSEIYPIEGISKDELAKQVNA